MRRRDDVVVVVIFVVIVEINTVINKMNRRYHDICFHTALKINEGTLFDCVYSTAGMNIRILNTTVLRVLYIQGCTV